MSYSDNTNAGTATATLHYAETANYKGSSDSQDLHDRKAATTTTVTCPAARSPTPAAAQSPARQRRPVAGLSDRRLTVSYSDNTNAGTATASAQLRRDANLQWQQRLEDLHHRQGATTTTTVTCTRRSVHLYRLGADAVLGQRQRSGGLNNQSVPVNYKDNINAGTATASDFLR